MLPSIQTEEKDRAITRGSTRSRAGKCHVDVLLSLPIFPRRSILLLLLQRARAAARRALLSSRHACARPRLDESPMAARSGKTTTPATERVLGASLPPSVPPACGYRFSVSALLLVSSRPRLSSAVVVRGRRLGSRTREIDFRPGGGGRPDKAEVSKTSAGRPPPEQRCQKMPPGKSVVNIRSLSCSERRNIGDSGPGRFAKMGGISE